MISEGEPYRIAGSHCLECGRCAEVCPDEAIDPAPGTVRGRKDKPGLTVELPAPVILLFSYLLTIYPSGSASSQNRDGDWPLLLIPADRINFAHEWIE